jgi:hypothetical protein
VPVDVQRFGDNHEVGARSSDSSLLAEPPNAREPTTLFVYGPADFNAACQADASTTHRFGSVDGRGDSRFHVARAAPVDTAIADDGGKRVDCPSRSSRDHVEVAVEMHEGPRGKAVPQTHNVDAWVRSGVFWSADGLEIFDVETTLHESRSD